MLMNFHVLMIFCLTISISNSVSISKIFIRKAIEIIDKAIPKDECSVHLQNLIKDAVSHRKLWALQMLDATAKFQAGFLTGNIYYLGNYDECINIQENKGRNGIIQGQYCNVIVSPANSTNDIYEFLDIFNSLTDQIILERNEANELKHMAKHIKAIYGICLPKSCRTNSIQRLWNYLENTFRLPLHITINEHFCSVQGKAPFVFGYDIYVFLFFGAVFSLVLLATIYDLFIHQQGSKTSIRTDCFLAFSAYKNCKSLFSSSPTKNAFSCLSGIKILSIFWIIHGHRSMFTHFSGILNMIHVFEWRKSIPALTVILAPFAVDTFFVISGLLLSNKYMQFRNILTGNHKFPFADYYLMRLLRLWPALLATILFYIGVLKYLNNGPLWMPSIYKTSYICSRTGWATALFIDNYIPFNHQCIGSTWYLAVDTQLYIIAPFILHCLWKYPRKTIAALLFLCIISVYYSYQTTVSYKTKWLPIEGDETYHSLLYQSVFARMPVWIFGLLLGAFIHNFPNIKLSKTFSIFLWIISLCIFIILTLLSIALIQHRYNEYTAAIYNSLNRPLWGLAICFIIFLCINGHGGWINDILSHRVFEVSARLSYSVYLVHFAVIYLIGGGKRSMTFYTNFQNFHTFLGDLPCIFMCGFVWCLAFESPFINLAKIVYAVRWKNMPLRPIEYEKMMLVRKLKMKSCKKKKNF